MKAKKSLGQNFLKSEPALRNIVTAGEVGPEDVVLEIGPGKGALTHKLLETRCKVLAIEKDRNLYELLQDKFKDEISSGQLILLNEDILEFNSETLPDLLSPRVPPRAQSAQGRAQGQKIREGFAYKIIANIPYNITGAILKKFLTDENQPKLMVLMVQNEVAKRIVARDPRHGGAGGKESVLSISVKAYGEPKMIMKVPARYFSPAPKVDSAVIAIKNISRKIFEESEIIEEKFWEIVKTGFAHKRKKLASNLKSLKFLKKEELEALGNKRAEDLPLSDWLALASGDTI